MRVCVCVLVLPCKIIGLELFSELLTTLLLFLSALFALLPVSSCRDVEQCFTGQNLPAKQTYIKKTQVLTCQKSEDTAPLYDLFSPLGNGENMVNEKTAVLRSGHYMIFLIVYDCTRSDYRIIVVGSRG